MVTKEEISSTGAMSDFRLMVLILSLFLRGNRKLAEFEMPILAYFAESSTVLKTIFCFGIIFALLSTLVTCLLGVKRCVRNSIAGSTNLGACFLSVMLAIIIGLLPYSFFTKSIYPIIGIINFIVFVFL